MAKSYKKFPGMSDGDCHKKFQKRQASRKVRYYKLWLPDGGAYKKLFNPWDICDHNYREYSWKDMWKECINFVVNFNYEKYEHNMKLAQQRFWRYVRK